MFSRLALRTLSRNIKPIPSTHLRNTRVFFSPPSPLPSPPSPLKPATPHYLPVIAKETGALRRNAFKNAANDAVALDRDELLKDVSKLSGKTVVITGSGSLEGLGGQLAIKAAEHGARVVVTDLKDEGIDRVVKEIERMGGCAFSSSIFALSERLTNSLAGSPPASLATSPSSTRSSGCS